MQNIKGISLVMPVYNEVEVIEKVIRKYYDEFFKYCKNSEFIITEDGSTDGTKEVLKKLQKELKFKLITSPQRKGYEKARNDALKLAEKQIVFFSDSDGQHDPKDFWLLYKEMKGKNIDLLIGCKMVRKDIFYRKITSKLGNFIYGILFGVWLRDTNCGFRVYKKKVIEDVVDDVRLFPYAGNAEFVIRAKHKGYKVGEYPVHHYKREVKQEGVVFSFKKMPKIIMKMLTAVIKLRIELFKKKLT